MVNKKMKSLSKEECEALNKALNSIGIGSANFGHRGSYHHDPADVGGDNCNVLIKGVSNFSLGVFDSNLRDIDISGCDIDMVEINYTKIEDLDFDNTKVNFARKYESDIELENIDNNDRREGGVAPEINW